MGKAEAAVLGGRARAESLTAGRRRAIARRAARARWDRIKEQSRINLVRRALRKFGLGLRASRRFVGDNDNYNVIDTSGNYVVRAGVTLDEAARYAQVK